MVWKVDVKKTPAPIGRQLFPATELSIHVHYVLNYAAYIWHTALPYVCGYFYRKIWQPYTAQYP